MIYDIWYFPFVVCVVCGFCFCRRPKAGPQCAVYTVYRSRQQVILISKQPACRPLAWTVDTPAPAPARRNAP